jgi:protein ImuA
MLALVKNDIRASLQSDILRMQGFKPASNTRIQSALGPMASSFPNATFPVGAVHEFLVDTQENAASTVGFLSGLLALLTQRSGLVCWISKTTNASTIFPPALLDAGLLPDRFLFVRARTEKDALWSMDEALKCAALTAVVGEFNDLTFMASRRLQLAVEQSQVTGFILRNTKRITFSACVSRWKVSPLPSISLDGLPGVGSPAWQVELQRIRNGKSGTWSLQWKTDHFTSLPVFNAASYNQLQRKAV